MIVMATAKPPEVVDLTLDVEELRVPYCRPAPTATPLHQHPPPIAPPNNHPANLPFLSIGSLTRPAHAHTPASPLTNGADTPRNVSTRAPLIQAPHLTNGTPRTLPLQTPASRTSLRLPSSRPSSSATDRKPTIGHNEITEDRPAKRQRTGSSLTGQRLHTLIESRMFPLIDDALQQQAPGYGRSAKNKIGYTTCQVLGPKFQREWNETGMLSMGFEEAARREALSLVSELKNRPDRWLTPGQLPPLPTVRPSIERIAARDEEDDTTDEDEDEEDDSDDESVDDDQPPDPPKPTPKKAPVTPQRMEARAKATLWQSGKTYQKEAKPSNRGRRRNTFFGLSSRPYVRAYERRAVLSGDGLARLHPHELRQPEIFHVGFSNEEVRYLRQIARPLYGARGHREITDKDAWEDLRHLSKKARKSRRMDEILALHAQGYHTTLDTPPRDLLTRSVSDVENFLMDISERKCRPTQHILTLGRDEGQNPELSTRTDPVPSLLFTREIAGNRGFGSLRRYENFSTAFKVTWEDHLEPRIEWTGCAGDISTISWVSKSQFICGTTTHSDSHNQQYNKPGNLLLGSCRGTLRAYPDHRIIRPGVSHGDNALASMVESQDPWLFSSVVSSDYDDMHNLAFTSSFDQTVKIWKVENDSMTAIGTWGHEGRVNFVVASQHPYGLVATAADVLTDAVRVYHFECTTDNLRSRFDAYSCTRIHDEDYVPSDKWGYFPAAIRWGLAPAVQHILLVGYSPRSLHGEEHEIPEDKVNTGELCLWDTLTKTQIKVHGGATQNVFEVIWHPSRDSFAAATSKADNLESKLEKKYIKTQIRIFERNADDQYGTIKTLDCAAADINELAMRPNSAAFSYIAASCTDGKVYVWDTSATDSPMCVLEHGEPVEELLGDREQEDVGVKFAAWGSTADRFYTGSSDGVVKVWNIRHGKAVLVRDLIEVAGPITFGAFSPDHTKLVIGDGTGRVCLLTLDEEQPAATDSNPCIQPSFLKLQSGGGQQRVIRHPRPFIPHPEVPPPDAKTSQELARGYLERQELEICPNPKIGAVQGPQYANTGLFRAEAHRNEDPSQPLLGAFERQQQENVIEDEPRRALKIKDIEEADIVQRDTHMKNKSVTSADLDITSLDINTRLELEAERAEVCVQYDYRYEED